MTLEPYYDADGITIYLGDCREVLPQLGRVTHVITDPPYEAEAHTMARRVKRGEEGPSWTGTDPRTLRTTALCFDAITEETRHDVAALMAPMVERWALVFCQAEAAHKWDGELIAAGLKRRRWCIWVKPDGQPQFSGDRPGMGYETIVACHAEGRSTWNGGGRLGVFRHVKNITGSQQSEPHPTTKPIALMRELVTLFSDPGDLILDPFMGSGTTLRAAKDLGRRAIGIEISQEYCDIAVQRMSQSVLPMEVTA